MKHVTHPRSLVDQNLRALQNGEENGLNFFYKRNFKQIFTLASRITKDDCIAEGIAQEAFLRLWLSKSIYRSEEKIKAFLQTQAKTAAFAFFQKSDHAFHQNLLRLDNIEGYPEFLFGYEMDAEETQALVCPSTVDAEKKEQRKKLEYLIPYLRRDQQHFIQLCLDQRFNDKRIAAYLGGISEDEVKIRLEKVIQHVRKIVDCSKKPERPRYQTAKVVHGELDTMQAEVFRLRYSMQLSFEEIASQLQLSLKAVKKLFIAAHANTSKKINHLK